MTTLAQKKIYVYIHLPGVPTPVLAGLMTSVDDEHNQVKQAVFKYAESYLARSDCKALDPIGLPFKDSPAHLYETAPKEKQVAFSIFFDSIPDAWGRARMLRDAGTDRLSPVDFILASGEDRSGFLAYGPDASGPTIVAPWAKAHNQAGLLDISDVALIIDEDEHITLRQEDAQKILIYGSSLGGARPKVTVKYEDRVWLAKPAKEGDFYNIPRAEFAALTLAKMCGLDAPAVKVITVNNKDVYLIERFDRQILDEQVQRRGFLSMYAAVGYPKRVMRPQRDGTYNVMAARIDQISRDSEKDKKELFGRIIFNVLVGNSDDHLKNHAFSEVDGAWRLSPLYDVLPVPFVPIDERRRLVASRFWCLGELIQKPDSVDSFFDSVVLNHRQVA